MNCKGSYPLPFFFLCGVRVIPSLDVLLLALWRLQSGDASGHSAHLAGSETMPQHTRSVTPQHTPITIVGFNSIAILTREHQGGNTIAPIRSKSLVATSP